MIVSLTICVSHAHTSVDFLSDSTISLTSADSLNENSSDKDIIQINCGSYCNHHVLDPNYEMKTISFLTKSFIFEYAPLILGELQYLPQRPPKV